MVALVERGVFSYWAGGVSVLGMIHDQGVSIGYAVLISGYAPCIFSNSYSSSFTVVFKTVNR